MTNTIEKIRHLVERYDERIEWGGGVYGYATYNAETGEETWHSVEQWFEALGYIARGRDAWEKCLVALGVEPESQRWEEAERTLSRWRRYVPDEEIHPVQVHLGHPGEHARDAQDYAKGSRWYDITK